MSADAYPCCHLQRDLKKGLALSKQVLLLSARHFYLRPPLSPSSGPVFLALPFKHVHRHSTPVEFHVQQSPRLPLYQPRAVQTEDGALDGRTSDSTPASRLQSGHGDCPRASPVIQITRRAPGLLCRPSGAAGPRRPYPTLPAGGLKRPPSSPHSDSQSMVSISISLVLLYPTDSSSPGELTGAESQDAGRSIVGDALQLAGFKLLWFRGWMRSEGRSGLAGV